MPAEKRLVCYRGRIALHDRPRYVTLFSKSKGKGYTLELPYNANQLALRRLQTSGFSLADSHKRCRVAHVLVRHAGGTSSGHPSSDLVT